MTVGGANYWLHFRVDNFIFTAVDGTNSNDTPALQAMKKSSNFDADAHTALYTDDNAAVIHVVTATLNNNKLTYQYDVYAATDTTMQSPVCTTVYEAESSVPLPCLAIRFFYADITSVKESTYSIVKYGVATIQNPSQESAFSYDSKAGYTASVWATEIRKGETLELKGKAEIGAGGDDGQKVWFGFVGALTPAALVDVFRMDDWVLGATANHPQNAFGGLNYAYNQDGAATDQLATNHEFDTTVKVDWTTATKIVITLKIDNTVTTWTITGTTELAEKYVFHLGLDHCSVNFTSAVRTAHTAATPAAD